MEPILYTEYFTKTFGEDFLQALKCSICLDYFENPVVLICGHTFCKFCIQKTADYVLSQNFHLPQWKVSMNCPECRRVFNAGKIAQNKANYVPNNYALTSLLELLQDIKVPIKQDASCITDSCSTNYTQAETGTQTLESPTPEQEVTNDYDVKQLDELEQDIINLCRLSVTVPQGEPKSAITTVQTCPHMPTNRSQFSKNKKQTKISKPCNQNIPKEFDFTKRQCCSTYDVRIQRRQKLTSNIAELTTDPEVLHYYNKLSK